MQISSIYLPCLSFFGASHGAQSWAFASHSTMQEQQEAGRLTLRWYSGRDWNQVPPGQSCACRCASARASACSCRSVRRLDSSHSSMAPPATSDSICLAAPNTCRAETCRGTVDIGRLAVAIMRGRLLQQLCPSHISMYRFGGHFSTQVLRWLIHCRRHTAPLSLHALLTVCMGHMQCGARSPAA